MTKLFAFFLLPFSLSALEVTPSFSLKPILVAPNANEDGSDGSFKTAFGFGLSGGATFTVGNVNIKPEVELAYRPSLKPKNNYTTLKSFSTMFNGNFSFKWKYSPYFELGLGNNNLANEKRDSSENYFTFQVGLGVNLKITEMFYLSPGYRYFAYTTDEDFDFYAHEFMLTTSFVF